MLTRLPAKIGCLLLLTTVAFCIFVEPAFCQIIPANRLPTWQGTVGVPGGIPNRTTIYKTESAGASESTIQADLNSCPSNQVVLLSAGTYTFTSTLTIPSYVTLRGAGMGSTIINASSVDYVIKAVASFSDDFGAPVVANHVSWTSGYAQNTSALTLSANNLAGGAESVPVGNIVMIDQLSDANCDASGGYGLQGVWWSIASPTSGADRYQHEIAYVTAKNGHTITIDPPIRYANYTASSSPQVWFEASSGPVKFAGIENLSVHNTGGNNSTHGIGLQYSYGCWILNCGESNFRYGLSEYFSVRCEIRHCAIGGLSGSGDDYDFSLYYTGGCLFEDNVVTNFDNAFLLESCIGDAFTYNYTTNTSRSAQGGNMTSGDFASHGGNNAMNLLEGNNFIQVSLDNGWGSAFGFVLFRNRIQGWDPSHTAYGNYVAAIDDYSMNRNMTFVGNVLGTSGKNTVYESQGTGNNLVFLTQLSISGVSPSPDPAVESSMVRAMNWTSATTTNGGLVSAGYTSADLPASLLYSSKPTYFGNLAWPPVDPTNPTYSSSITNIPAGYRQVYKTDPPSGGAVANQPPVATASATPTSGQAPLAVSFSSAGSSDPEGATLTYSWNFGDTMSSTSANPSHTYSTPGTYSASLTVSDGTNSTTSTPLSITVNAAAANQPPVAVAAGTPTTGAAPLNVTFSSAGSYDPEGAGLSYYWDFGDGTNSTAATSQSM
jgi:PKD repeat protein